MGHNVLIHLLMWNPVFFATTEPPVIVDGHDPGQRRKQQEGLALIP